MQSTWLRSLCHDATAIEMQQSKIQCYSHHTPIQLLAQPIIQIQPPVMFGSWMTFRRQLSKSKGKGEGVCLKLLLFLFFPFSLFCN